MNHCCARDTNYEIRDIRKAFQAKRLKIRCHENKKRGIDWHDFQKDKGNVPGDFGFRSVTDHAMFTKMNIKGARLIQNQLENAHYIDLLTRNPMVAFQFTRF